MDPATGKWLDSSAKFRATNVWPMMTNTQAQMNGGPPTPMATACCVNEPVATLM